MKLGLAIETWTVLKSQWSVCFYYISKKEKCWRIFTFVNGGILSVNRLVLLSGQAHMLQKDVELLRAVSRLYQALLQAVFCRLSCLSEFQVFHVNNRLL